MNRRRYPPSNLAHKRPDSGDLPAPFSDTPPAGTIVQICCICNEMRDDSGRWRAPEADAPEPVPQTLSHGYCPKCAKRLERELDIPDDDQAP